MLKSLRGTWAERAVFAWRVTHPDATGETVWAIVPGNTLSGKDPREDVHSLHTGSAACGYQYAQGSLAWCDSAWRNGLLPELIENGCTVTRIRS